jgi:DNA mismatch repair protein MSH4
MMIDLSTIASLELIQNLQNQKSKHSLFGLLNETLTAMGARFLRSNVLQPSTDEIKVQDRYEALEEITMKEELFFAVRNGSVSLTDLLAVLTWSTALKSFIDTDRVLASVSNE